MDGMTICSLCKAENPGDSKYCNQCGAPLDPIVGRLQDHLQANLKAEVERVIEARLKDQKTVELDTSLAIAERLASWAKLFGTFVGLPMAALVLTLGFLGFRTYADFSELTKRAQATITAKLDQATTEAQTAETKASQASSQAQKLADVAEQKLAEVSALSSEVVQLKSRASDVQLQLVQASKLTGEVQGLASRVTEIEQRFTKIGRVAILAANPGSVEGLVSYLATQGGESAVLSTLELGKLSLSDPGLVIVWMDTESSWTSQPQWALRRIFERYKVLGIGRGGAQLFSVLGLEINAGQSMHSQSESPLVVENATLLAHPLSVSSPGGIVQVAQPGSDAIGVYDAGSPDILGFEGIARWSTAKSHWPIARQGNYLLWGFDAPIEKITDAGKNLLVNLLISHKLRPEVPLSQTVRRREYIQTGLIAERLNAQFPTNSYYFQVRQGGHISAKLSWTPADRSLSLVVNGPGKGQDRPFARKDGVSPVEVALNATDAQVATGGNWSISVNTYDKTLGTAAIDYRLELTFPGMELRSQ